MGFAAGTTTIVCETTSLLVKYCALHWESREKKGSTQRVCHTRTKTRTRVDGCKYVRIRVEVLRRVRSSQSVTVKVCFRRSRNDSHSIALAGTPTVIVWASNLIPLTHGSKVVLRVSGTVPCACQTREKHSLLNRMVLTYRNSNRIIGSRDSAVSLSFGLGSLP